MSCCVTDPLPLAQALMRCNSVTPADGGSLSVLSHALERLGFTVTRLKYGEIENLFARYADCLVAQMFQKMPQLAALAPTPLPASSVPPNVILIGVCLTSMCMTSRILSMESACCSFFFSL